MSSNDYLILRDKLGFLLANCDIDFISGLNTWARTQYFLFYLLPMGSHEWCIYFSRMLKNIARATAAAEFILTLTDNDRTLIPPLDFLIASAPVQAVVCAETIRLSQAVFCELDYRNYVAG